MQRIIEQFGSEPADVGGAAAARAIEPLCQIWCVPPMRGGGSRHLFRMMRV